MNTFLGAICLRKKKQSFLSQTHLKLKTMSRAEKFIQDCTRNCSNETTKYGSYNHTYHEWLTPDQARKAVEISREEMMEDITIFLEGAHEYTDNKLLQMQYDNEGLIRDFREFVRNTIMKDE